MQINIIKKHSAYPLGVVDVDEKRAEYLVRVGVAEYSKWVGKENIYSEKNEFIQRKEKAENRSGNVPTAKKRKP